MRPSPVMRSTGSPPGASRCVGTRLGTDDTRRRV
ncbi:Uncharacterised protein [Bordetella pertussis]|nr:Uncharacterised protein [Bordetella pertussis]